MFSQNTHHSDNSGKIGFITEINGIIAPLFFFYFLKETGQRLSRLLVTGPKGEAEALQFDYIMTKTQFYMLKPSHWEGNSLQTWRWGEVVEKGRKPQSMGTIGGLETEDKMWRLPYSCPLCSEEQENTSLTYPTALWTRSQCVLFLALLSIYFKTKVSKTECWNYDSRTVPINNKSKPMIFLIM